MLNLTTIRVPKKYEERIETIEHDIDGYWVYLNYGWHWDDYGLHTIHEDTHAEILKRIRETEPCDCDRCIEGLKGVAV